MKFGKVTRYILFGGGSLLIKFSEFLKAKGYEVVVYTSPRHAQEFIGKNKLKKILEKKAIYCHICNNINAETDINKYISGSIGISFGAAWIFKKAIIDKFNGKLLNLHGACLPQSRGGGNPTWRILDQNRQTCSLIHKVNTEVDAGDIIKFKEYFYPVDCRLPKDYFDVSLEKNYEFLKELIGEIEKDKDFKLQPQQEYFSTYWPRLNTEKHGLINWSWGTEEIVTFICGFDSPFKGASTYLKNAKVHIKEVLSNYNNGSFHPFQIGFIYRKTDDKLFVASRDGTIIVGKIYNEKGKNIFKEINIGDRLYTPLEKLEEAMQYRAIYTPEGLK